MQTDQELVTTLEAKITRRLEMNENGPIEYLLKNKRSQ